MRRIRSLYSRRPEPTNSETGFAGQGVQASEMVCQDPVKDKGKRMAEKLMTGCYTGVLTEGAATVHGGKGISIYELKGAEAKLLSACPVENPSFFLLNREKGYVYAVTETDSFQGRKEGGVNLLSFDGDSLLTPLVSCGSGGTSPCHIAVRQDGRLLAVSNYGSGTVSFFALDEEGRLIPESRQTFCHAGCGPVTGRQEGPHAHSTAFSPDGQYALVQDLGADRIKFYRTAEDGEVTPEPEKDISAVSGSGPRLGAFLSVGEKCFYYVVNELSSTVSRYLWEGDRLSPVDSVDTLPEGTRLPGEVAEGTKVSLPENTRLFGTVSEEAKACMPGEENAVAADVTDIESRAGKTVVNTAGDLRVSHDEKHIYVTNRGHDSVTCFAVEEDGALRQIANSPSGGRVPRYLAVNKQESLAAVANQESDLVSIFRLEDGRLVPAGQICTGMPSCAVFVEED